MTKDDALMLDFADAFERELIGQGEARRTVQDSLDTGISLIKRFSLEVKG
jgi:V/A-type H+-transporting ATPase subunit B